MKACPKQNENSYQNSIERKQAHSWMFCEWWATNDRNIRNYFEPAKLAETEKKNIYINYKIYMSL